MCLPIAAAIIVVMGLSLLTTVQFLMRGITTEGVIETCHHERPQLRGSGSIEITYSYTSPEQGPVKGSAYITHNYINCDTIPVDNTLQIQYLSAPPLLRSRVVDSRLAQPILESLIPSIAFCAALYGSIMFSSWGIKSLVRFLGALFRLPRLKKGVVLDGILIDCAKRAEYGRRHGLQTTFEFKSPTGKELKGRQFYHRANLWNEILPAPGTPIKILYVSDKCYIML